MREFLYVGIERCQSLRVPLKGFSLHRVGHAEVYHLVERYNVTGHIYIARVGLAFEVCPLRVAACAGDARSAEAFVLP